MPRRIAQERVPTASNVGSRNVTWASQHTSIPLSSDVFAGRFAEQGKDPVPFSPNLRNLRNLRFTSNLRFSGLVGVSTTTCLTKTVSQAGPALNRTGDSSAQYRFLKPYLDPASCSGQAGVDEFARENGAFLVGQDE